MTIFHSLPFISSAFSTFADFFEPPNIQTPAHSIIHLFLRGMQSKGVVRFFLIALTIVCLYQYLLVIPTNSIESDARAYAEECAGKNPKLGKQACYAQYLDSISTETVFEIPLIKKFTYADLKKSQLAMGSLRPQGRYERFASGGLEGFPEKPFGQ